MSAKKLNNNKATTVKSKKKTSSRKKAPKKSLSKKNNPLFVVTNKGKTVEQADNFFDAFVKRFGLGPVLEFFNTVCQSISESVTSYAGYLILKNFVDEFVELLTQFQENVDSYSELAMAKLEGLLGKVYGR